MGIYNKGTVKLEPTTPLCWQWEKIEYYWEKTVKALVENIDPQDGCNISHLFRNVSLPPPMYAVDFTTFMRKYPDIFHMERNTTGNDNIHVTLNKAYSLPTWV